MRSAAVLALLLCAGQVTALPVNSPMNKGDTEVMKCIVEVISDTLSKPSPMPVSQECFETLRGDERILSILRHQNLLKELQDLALQGAKERAHQQKKHSGFEDELSEVLENQSSQAELKGRSEALAVDGAGKPGAEEAQDPEGKGEQEHSQQKEEEEEMAVVPQGLFRGGKSGELEQEQEEERLSKEWEDSKRWSKMDQLAKELTAEKRLEGQEEEEDNRDSSMKLSFRARAYGFRGPGPQLRRGWRPSSREDSLEAGLPLQVRGYPEEKKEEEGSANRRPEDQELESLSAIEAELEKVAHQLQALRRG
ncbi:CHGA isoform 2 [Pan troglodytes]|uniref:Chromogranin-A n=3 Tax=Pan TaxID=9596 RepID=A0A6D2WQW4_PANTR|nr:chromogranin-A isoform X2 [Pan troglodytes]XP_034793931.1 chromogranin-A isoform X2 [Pan paniscus]PNI97601.1 CHGA isoform 2 [Pan troglodytes]